MNLVRVWADRETHVAKKSDCCNGGGKEKIGSGAAGDLRIQTYVRIITPCTIYTPLKEDLEDVSCSLGAVYHAYASTRANGGWNAKATISRPTIGRSLLVFVYHVIGYHNSLPGTSSVVGEDSLLVDIGMDLEKASRLESGRRGGASHFDWAVFRRKRTIYSPCNLYYVYIS